MDGSSSPIVGYYSREEAAKLLEHWGWQFPTEAQWECACRGGGGHQLFFFGDELPAEEELAGYIELDPDAWKPNPFGLVGLFGGEWCRENYRETPGSPPLEGVYTMRGGASGAWPWQDTGEWTLCLSAARSPHTEIWPAGDSEAWGVLRPVIELPA